MTHDGCNDETTADDLVVRAKVDREAFGALYDRFFPLVHRYCHRRLRDNGAAEDVSSEVFLQVAGAMRRFPGTTVEDFRRWVYRIATNAINAHLRQKTRRAGLLARAVQSGGRSTTDEISSALEPASFAQESISRALAHLSHREQSVLTLRFMEGLSYEEVAAVLNVRSATLRVVASRAIKNLRRRLSQSIDAPLAEQPTRPTP
ncbi:MAG TPA: sigma-70 family RNA polymerase sigma factor [Pirellulales bacterium]|jgi:RNA polymerase sigma-70 factor (ECF subfamily)